MVYGARLFDVARNFVIRDAEFSTNLESHFKNCVFGDVMLYQKSLTDLAKAADLWAAIGPGSEARSQEWRERQGDGTVTSNIVTCRQAYGALSAQWANMIEANTPLWAKEVYPKLSNDVAAAKLRHDVPIVNSASRVRGTIMPARCGRIPRSTPSCRRAIRRRAAPARQRSTRSRRPAPISNLTDQQRAVRQEMISRWMREKEVGLREEIVGAIGKPALVTVAHLGTTSAADVASSYHPQEPAALPSAPSPVDQGRAGALIEAGRTRLADDRAAAQARAPRMWAHQSTSRRKSAETTIAASS